MSFPLLVRESKKNIIFPYSTLVENKTKTETTLLPYFYSVKRNENKIIN